MFTGVFFSDVPLDANEGAKGDVHLRIEIPEELIAEYEWVDESGEGTYREFCIPAALANQYGPPARLTEDEANEVYFAWHEKFKDMEW